MAFIITILAAGQGKRMRSDLPKVLHLFNKKPMLVRILEVAATLSPDKIVVVTGKFHKQIINTLSKYMDIFGIIFVEQPNPCGTGNAIDCCLPHYESSDSVLILNGDMPLITTKIIENIRETVKGFSGAIVVAKLESPKGYGRIIYYNNNFEKIVEESSCTEEERQIDIINTGVYLFSGDVLKTYIPKLDNNNSKQEYYLTDIIKYMRQDGLKINTLLLNESENIYIKGVNTPEELAELEGLHR